MSAQLDAASGGTSEGGYTWFEVREIRCGCQFVPYTSCFETTTMDRGGYYVIATGAPGCEGSKLFASTGIDPAQCGSRVRVTGGVRHGER